MRASKRIRSPIPPLSRIIVAVLLVTVGARSAHAHDFWLQPADFVLPQPQETTVTLLVGHGPSRQRSPITPDRVVRFAIVLPDGTTVDRIDALHLGQPDADGMLRFDGRGTHFVVFETDARAQSHLPAIRFNDYLVAEGLTPALDQRRRAGRMDLDGSENYRRIAKAIVQVGGVDATAQTAVTTPVGLPLEIVPERDPHAQPAASELPVRVLFEGRPLAGALVKLTRLENDAEPVATQVTDGAGRAHFPMPTGGSWLVNVIWTKVLPASSETDFETTFSSLTFGFAGAEPQLSRTKADAK